jgi:hypothetical protein
MNIIVLAIKPMQPEEPRFPVRVEFNWGNNDEIFSNSAITVEVWLDKTQLRRSTLSKVHDAAVAEAYKLLERALDSASAANVITGF